VTCGAHHGSHRRNFRLCAGLSDARINMARVDEARRMAVNLRQAAGAAAPAITASASEQPFYLITLMAAETTAVGACPKANRVATDRTGRAKGLLPCGNSASGACSSPQLCILTKLRHPYWRLPGAAGFFVAVDLCQCTNE
jgi:hypothetical protein